MGGYKAKASGVNRLGSYLLGLLSSSSPCWSGYRHFNPSSFTQLSEMQLSFLFILLTLISSLAALPVSNLRAAHNGLGQGTPADSLQQRIHPVTTNRNSFSQEQRPMALRHPEEDSSNSVDTNVSPTDRSQNLMPRAGLGKLFKNLVKLANSKIGKAVGKAFGNFDWRPQWQKDLQRVGLRPPDCKRHCWGGNGYSKEFREQAKQKGIIIP